MSGEPDMVERVARAICEAHGDPRYNVWRQFVDEARAAIAAMHPPTHEMLNAGSAARDGGLYGSYKAMIGAALALPDTPRPEDAGS